MSVRNSLNLFDINNMVILMNVTHHVAKYENITSTSQTRWINQSLDRDNAHPYMHCLILKYIIQKILYLFYPWWLKQSSCFLTIRDMRAENEKRIRNIDMNKKNLKWRNNGNVDFNKDSTINLTITITSPIRAGLIQYWPLYKIKGIS